MEEYRPIGKLNPSTLVYSVAAVVISLPSIHEEISKISKALINKYPQYSKNKLEVITHDPNKTFNVEKQEIIQYALNGPNREWGVLLTEERIILQTTAYDGFKDFGERFEEALNTIQEITGVKYQTGLAFRHIDNLMPFKGTKLSDAIKTEFLTPNFSDEMTASHSRHEYVYSVKDRNLIFRLQNYDQGKAYSIPQEIYANFFGLKGRPYVPEQAMPFILADFEANNIIDDKPAEEFDISEIIKELDKLHKLSSIAYRQVITPEEIELRGGQK